MRFQVVSSLLFLICIFVQSCTPKFEIDGFSSDTWKSDRNGCGGMRIDQVQILVEATDEILGQSENRIIALLGSPDNNKLYPRNQKIFIYFIESGPECINTTSPDSARYLSIRINALGRVSELFLYDRTTFSGS